MSHITQSEVGPEHPLMRWWEEYTEREGAETNANSSSGQQGRWPHHDPGNIARCDGESRSSNLVNVVNYAEAVTKKVFVFMDTPGYDPVAATGQAAGGVAPWVLGATM